MLLDRKGVVHLLDPKGDANNQHNNESTSKDKIRAPDVSWGPNRVMERGGIHMP